MTRKRKSYQAELKARVALEAYKGIHSVTELSQEYHIHPNVILKWRDQLLRQAATLFSHGNGSTSQEVDQTGPLYAEIGRLKMEVDWLKKKL